MKGGRLSKVRTDPRAVGLKRSIHTRSCCKRKRKRDRKENMMGASKAELISPKALGKTPLVATIGRGSQLLASPNSRKMGQDFSQNCYGQADICPDSLSGRHNDFVQRPGPFFRSIPDISIVTLPTILPKYSGYFDDSISRKWSPKYSEYFEKMVGGCDSRTAFPKIWNISGNWSLQKMKPLCLSHICRGSPDRFGQAVRRKCETVISSRGSPD